MPTSSVYAVPDRSAAVGGTAARILIIEDDFFVALEIEHRLLEAGYDVVGVAASADEALAIASDTKPDIAIVDIRIAGARDGIDAAVDLHKLGVPSVFASAHDDKQTRSRAQLAQPLGWIVKPYSAAELVQLLKRALSAKS